MMRWLAIASVAALGLFPTHLAAQSVAGRVVDGATGRGLTGAWVALLDTAGAPLRTTLSDSTGAFYLRVETGGTYRLEARLLGYGQLRTETVRVGASERVEVTLRLAVEAVALAPLEVVGRRVDPRHLGTLEGFLRRWEELPKVGPRRAVRRGEPEMRSAIRIGDVVQWFGEPGIPGNTAWFWNGKPASASALASLYGNTPMEWVEGIEFYRREIDAPLEYRTGRPCAAMHRCPVLVLWGRLPDGLTVEDAVAAEYEPAPEPPPAPLATAELSLDVTIVRAGDAALSGLPPGVRPGWIVGGVQTAGSPLAAAVVELLGPNGERLGITRADEAGRFELRLPAPGAYHLRALHEDHAPATTGLFEVGSGEGAAVVLTFRSG